MLFQSFSEAVQYLYRKLPYFSRDGKSAYKSDIGNITVLAEAIGNPHRKFRSVHIAGTNGKGSTSHLLAAVFQAANYPKVGLYTSPHLLRFTERIKINGQEVPEDYVTKFLSDHYDLIEQVQPSFFEVTVALAFDWFANQQVDVAIIETGLGGRLDSTNIILPLLSIITNISWDHQDLLGDTLVKIAGEKAGIIKPEVPCVIGESAPETMAVFNVISEANHSPLFEAATLGNIEYAQQHWVWRTTQGKKLTFNSQLNGYYQRFNFRTVLAAIAVLQKIGIEIPDRAVWKGFSDVVSLTGLRGRWEVVNQNPLIVIDVAHNQAGVSEVVAQIGRASDVHKWHIVWGMVGDKEPLPVLSWLPPEPTYYWCAAQMPRSLLTSTLAVLSRQLILTGDAHSSVASALISAIHNYQPGDCILITGSTFVVAEALETVQANFNANVYVNSNFKWPEPKSTGNAPNKYLRHGQLE